MLTFDRDAHIYEIDGKQLTSVSAWVNQFVPEFNANIISSIMSRKSEMTPEEIRAKWELKGKIAREQGDWVHDSIQYYLKYDNEFDNEPVKEFKKLQTKNVYYSEMIVYDEQYAGTIDLIEVLGNKKVKIHDFKTNADLYKKKGKLKAPYKDLANTPINKYRLQLSKYKEMLEKMKGVEVVELNLWWWAGGKFEIINVESLPILK